MFSLILLLYQTSPFSYMTIFLLLNGVIFTIVFKIPTRAMKCSFILLSKKGLKTLN
uniref:ATP synthase F0 subunit 8 n=1 Tax=Trichuris sp. TMM5 TaxID=2810713 RepID=A0A891GTM5_9BILA|nr:ATP synthase F0 subunit 8 [Trichuris sp. TMM5]